MSVRQFGCLSVPLSDPFPRWRYARVAASNAFDRRQHGNPNPNTAMSDCYIQACRILEGGRSGISMVSRVWIRVKVMVRDCVKGLMWYGCSVPAAE